MMTPMGLIELAEVTKASVKTLFRQLDGWNILGDILQAKDKYEEWIVSRNYYGWYYVIGALLRPTRIAEIGTRYGYSLWSIVRGSGLPLEDYSLWVYDNQSDGEETLGFVDTFFRGKGVKNLEINRVDTQKIITLDIPSPGADLVHVDGDHTENGVYQDLILARNAVCAGGWILVDDTNPGPVRNGCERFCSNEGFQFASLPTLRGMYLIKIPTR